MTIRSLLLLAAAVVLAGCGEVEPTGGVSNDGQPLEGKALAERLYDALEIDRDNYYQNSGDFPLDDIQCDGSDCTYRYLAASGNESMGYTHEERTLNTMQSNFDVMFKDMQPGSSLTLHAFRRSHDAPKVDAVFLSVTCTNPDNIAYREDSEYRAAEFQKAGCTVERKGRL